MTDKNWSFTDRASFLIMEEERLAAAPTHDRHFAQQDPDAAALIDRRAVPRTIQNALKNE